MGRGGGAGESARRVPISVTLDKELYDFLENMIDRRMFKDRSHVVNAALDYLKWTIENKPMDYFGPRKPSSSPPSPPPAASKDPRLPR
jgi:hypothetical protein